MASPNSSIATLPRGTESEPALSSPPSISSAPSNCASKHPAFAVAKDAQRWKPSWHIQAPSGWMNDPCAPGYDFKTGLYRVSFQWNPNGNDWGEISWGTATSLDMIHWTVQAKPSLSPDTPCDAEGVFTGCLLPTRDGSLACAYTSVNALPIHHTLPHIVGSESLSLALSTDGGASWTKIDRNPILPSEPLGLNVTGWRDPYVAKWDGMCQFLGLKSESTLFGIISGGIRDVTPTTFLYAIDVNDLTEWTYVGPLVNFGLNHRPSRWSGDLGKNWEVTNFTVLRDDNGLPRNFLIMGTEGCVEKPHKADGPIRPARGQLWMSGTLQKPLQVLTHSSTVEMTYDFGGHLDHGCLYAANSFLDPVSQKQIVWGWITEEDLCDELRHAQGWSGMLSMPRELYIQTIYNAVRSLGSDLASITSIDCMPDENGTNTVRTLASRPFQPLVEALRKSAGVKVYSQDTVDLTSNPAILGYAISPRWELNVEMRVSNRAKRVGVRFEHSEDPTQCTELFFQPSQETITINRPDLPGDYQAKLINSSPETAPHTLFTTRDRSTGDEITENLHIQAWRDNSVLEVFVNGRTAISTRIYGAEETLRLLIFSEDSEDDADQLSESCVSQLVCATLWDRIGLGR